MSSKATNHWIMIRMILINEIGRQCLAQNNNHHRTSITTTPTAMHVSTTSTRSKRMKNKECIICTFLVLVFLIIPVLRTLISMDETCSSIYRHVECHANRFQLIVLALFMIILISLCGCYICYSHENSQREHIFDYSNYGMNPVVHNAPSIVTNTNTILTIPTVTTPLRHENDGNEATDDLPPSFESVIVDVEQPPPKYETCVHVTHVNIDRFQ